MKNYIISGLVALVVALAASYAPNVLEATKTQPIERDYCFYVKYEQVKAPDGMAQYTDDVVFTFQINRNYTPTLNEAEKYFKKAFPAALKESGSYTIERCDFRGKIE